eukprot:g5878.t1
MTHMARLEKLWCLNTAWLGLSTWTTRGLSAQCIYDSVVSTVPTGGGSPNNRLAVTPDGLTMVSTANTEKWGNTTHQVLQRAEVAADGHFGALENYTFQTVSVNYPNPVAFSGDGQNLYVAVPSVAAVYTFVATAIDDYINQEYIPTEDCFYIGPTSSDTLVVTVSKQEIRRFQRDGSTGSLVLYDTTDVTADWTEIAVANGDPTGDYVVLVRSALSSKVEVYAVGDTVNLDAVAKVEDKASSSSSVWAAKYIVMSPDSSSIYIHGRLSSGSVILLQNAPVGGEPSFVGDFISELPSSGYTFVAIHPDGSYLYALNEETGTLAQHARGANGSLTSSVVCEHVTGQVDTYNSILTSPDGRYLYVADGSTLYSFATHVQTAAPTTPAPTTPAPITPAPITPAPTTLAPTTAARTTPTPTTPTPTTPAPTTAAPTTSAPNTLTPTMAAPTTPVLTTPAPSTPRPSTAATSTLEPTSPAPAPVQTTPGPATAAPVLRSDAPLLLSAVLSNTQTAFTLAFNTECYCSESTVDGADVSLCGFNAVSGEFDYGCDIDRLLGEETLSFLGFGPTCEWSADSSAAIVSYNETADSSLVASERNIMVVGGYILGEVSSISSGTEYTAGTVALEKRTTPPELLQAQFSDEGGTIIVTFSPEGSASSGLLDANDLDSGSGPGSCHALLNTSSIPPLGEAASCEWTDARELTIRLGYDAYVMPEPLSNASSSCVSPFSCITLMDGGVRTEASAVLSSSGSTPILAPANPPLVSAVLVAPQVVGRCGSFELDGRASSGGAARTLSAFWSVSAAEGSSAALATANASLAPFQGFLLAELNATALEVGVQFTFSLAVQNFLENMDEAAVTVTRIDEDVPSLLVLGSAARTVKRAQTTSLRMTAFPPPCGETQRLTFAWSEAGATGFDEVGTEVFQALEQRDATTLTLPPYTLGYPGSMYLFTATATSQSSLRSSAASVEVSVEQGALRATIAGGQFRQHTAGKNLVLDGSGSLDEDDIAALSMRYNWWCSENCTIMGEDSWTTSADDSMVSIPAEELEAGVIYEISLNVSKGSLDSSEEYGQLRWDTTSVRVQVISFEAPEVVVVAKDSTAKHNPTKKVVVFGSTVEEEDRGYELQWTQAEGDLDLEEEDWSTFFTTPQSGFNLVIRPNVLTGGATYTFRLSALDPATLATGFVELSVVVNAPPTGGYVDASPRAGYAAVDIFSLESLDWADDVDDLPLLFFFAYTNNQEEGTGDPLLSLSMFATESPEWEGPLPQGSPSEDYTILIAGQVSDSYGATATASTNATGGAVTVRVTVREASTGESASYAEAYSETLDVFGGIPGRATSAVRAYASLLPDESDDSSPPLSAEETELLQNWTATMIQDVANDFDALEYSGTTAEAVLDTLALLSESETSLNQDSKGALLSVSANVLDRAVNYGSWDSDGFTSTLEVLDNVMGGYNASPAGVVGRDSLGEEPASILPAMVHSMGLLMEAGLEDGEDPMVISGDYVNVLCQVTSMAGALDFETDSSTVVFPEGIVDPAAVSRRTRRLEISESRSNRCTPDGHPRGFPQDRYPCRRRLQSTSTPAAATVTISSMQFNAFGSPSSAAEAGVTSITVTKTSDREDAPLLAPVQITMRASVSSGSHESSVPTCSYYNEEIGAWDAAGLATESLSSSSDDGGEEGDVNLTCFSFHLSHFTVSADAVEAVFQPVSLTAGVEVILKVREVSFMGVVLLLLVLLLLAVLWTTSKVADAKSKLAQQLAGTADAWYIATGTSGRHPSLSAIAVVDPLDGTHRNRFQKGRRRLRRRGKKMLRRHLMQRLRRQWHQLRGFLRLVMEYHPWFGILSPSSSNLALTREQLSLLIFSSIMVHMMVKASFIGNSTDYRVQFAQILVSLVVSMPGSIIIPKLFETASAPPSSLSTKPGWKSIVPSRDLISAQRVDGGKAHEERWLRDSHSVVAIFHLVFAAASTALKRAPHAVSAGRPYATGRAIARGRSLVWSGFRQLLLDLVCVAISASIGTQEKLDKALISTAAGGVLVGCLFLEAVLSTRGSSFSIINFKTLFFIVFVRLVLTVLQLVLGFHQFRNTASSSGLYMVIFVLSIVKTVMSYKSELVPSMDAINASYMEAISLAKRYRSAPANRRHTQISSTTSIAASNWRDSSAIKIQAIVRRHQAYNRATRRQELEVWHGPEVGRMREKQRFRAYTCLAVYTLVVAWINLCYVATYDTAAIRSWVASTALTVLADILLRKPLSVLALATFYTIRDNVRVPQTVFVGTGRSIRPIEQL